MTLSAKDFVWRIKPGQQVSLKTLDPRHDGGLEREAARGPLAELPLQLEALQEKLYAAGSHAVLLVLQGMDTSGKDGTVTHVMSSVNPLACRATAFRVPTPQEQAHDFLWRIHAAVPSKGQLGIFNRSHYEDVLVPRVHGTISKETWQQRYEHINHFERLLVDSGTILVKCFLHISKGEQGERLKAREEEADKRWKINPGDYAERERWDAYQEAYEDLLAACSTPQAPWYVVPADRKWQRNLAVAQLLVETLRAYEAQWERTLRERGERIFKELQEARASRSF
jgi:PPK2 family polyphosphate:nucleotide phosphotransferase